MISHSFGCAHMPMLNSSFSVGTRLSLRDGIQGDDNRHIIFQVDDRLMSISEAPSP